MTESTESTESTEAAANAASAHKACERCREARAVGDYAAALKCHRCKGTGVVRTRESWICNGCGGGLCPAYRAVDPNTEIPHGLVDARVEGGYRSPALSDTTTYTFSLCEHCLRKLFDTFKVPPRIGECRLGGGADREDVMEYAEEAAGRREQIAENRAQHEEFERRVAEGRCTVRDHADGGALMPYCARKGIAVVDNGWDKRPVCAHHLRNYYARRDGSIHVDARYLSADWRKYVGRRYLAAFAKNSPIEPADEHEAAIFISTLLVLVAKPATHADADFELRRISFASPPVVTEWIDTRIPATFGPACHATAADANAWLWWGREQGYHEAVACACLGYEAALMWTDRGAAEDVDDAGGTKDETPAPAAPKAPAPTLITQNEWSRARARRLDITVTPEPGTSHAFEREKDEERARRLCFDGGSFGATLIGPFMWGWDAHRDYRRREISGEGAFAPRGSADPTRPPSGSMAAVLEWYRDQTGVVLSAPMHAAFGSGWNGAALWVNENVPTNPPESDVFAPPAMK